MAKIYELSYFGHVTNGQLKIRDRKGFDAYLLQFEGKDVEIMVKRKKAKRSIDQNAFFHAWVNLLSDHTGYSKEEMKEILKNQFLSVEKVNAKTGSIFKYTRSTASLNKNEFAEFCNDVQRWSIEEFNAILPLPNENWELIFE